jgi:hypothetical protein
MYCVKGGRNGREKKKKKNRYFSYSFFHFLELSQYPNKQRKENHKITMGKGSSLVLLDWRGLQLMAKMAPLKSQGHHAATCPIIKKIIK